MYSIVDYNDYDLALMASAIMQELTGDKCVLKRVFDYIWRIVRVDPSGREVEWE